MRGTVTFGSTDRLSASPAPNVIVTNGIDVVTSNSRGEFDLPDRGAFVSISRPSGFTCDDWWRPAASGAFDFVLQPQRQEVPYSFVHMTDTHMTLPESHPKHNPELAKSFGLYQEGSLPSEIASFLHNLPSQEADVSRVLITGDLVDHGAAAEFEAFRALLAESPIPVEVIPGNHDHMANGHGMFISRNNYLTNQGSVETYESFLGPRWFSFTMAGLHVIALDWHSDELGIDDAEQREWLHNHMRTLAPGTPWILMYHDQPSELILNEAAWPPLATFSGHWHTSRVVQVGATMHVNSPTPFFASLDYTPPAYRVVTWDGIALQMRTQTMDRSSGFHAETEVVSHSPEAQVPLESVRTATFSRGTAARGTAPFVWRTQLSGASHRQTVAIADNMIVAGTQYENRACGTVEAVETATGALLWRAQTGSAVKTTPVILQDQVIAAEVSGDVAAYDRTSGATLWRVASSNPLRRFAWGGAATYTPAHAPETTLVILGDASDLRAIDAHTGKIVWHRTDLSPHHNLVNHAAPLIVGDLLVMGFWPTPHHPIGLNAATGETVWTAPTPSWASPEGDEAAPSRPSFEELKRLLVMGTASFDERRSVVLMPTFAHTTVRELATGNEVFSVSHVGGFSPATPLVTDEGYVATVAGHGLQLIDADTGCVIWQREISGAAPFPMASYTKQLNPVISAPVTQQGTLLLTGLDGIVRRLETRTGRDVGHVPLGVPVASSLVAAGLPSGHGAESLQSGDSGLSFIGIATDGSVFALPEDVAS